MNFGFQSGMGGSSPVPNISYGLFAQTDNSSTITGITETSLIGSGVGTLSVPPDGFQVGDSFQLNMSGHWNTKVNDHVTIRLKSLGIVLADSGLQILDNTIDGVWQMTIFFTIRKIGIAGSSSIVTNGLFNSLKTSNGTPEAFGFYSNNSSTFDTTISNQLDVTAQFDSADPTNKMVCNTLVLHKIF